MINADKFDFLNKPGQISKLREESRLAAINDWNSLDLVTRISSVAQQFIVMPRNAIPDDSNPLVKNPVSLQLMTKRLEYTFEYFRGLLRLQLMEPERLTLKEKADQNFVSELRFLTTRMVGISYLLGFNCAAFGYFGLFRHLKLYLCIPFTAITFYLGKNLSLKRSINRLYYPIEPLYEEVRRH